MTARKLEPKAVQCARQIDGHDYQRSHKEYSFTDAFNTFKTSGNWKHLSIPESMATMSLLEKALQLWTSSNSTPAEHFKQHLDAFYSLYELLKDLDRPHERMG
jgi:hypothetical protein